MPPLRVARFLRAYLRDRPDVAVSEHRIRSESRWVDATLYAPGHARSCPPWVALHGVTVTGRRHVSLVRFARALAAAGNAVVVPEIPSWTALRVDPRAAAETIVAAERFLRERAEARPGPVRVVGFSVGATQALIAAAEPEVAPAVDGVVAFGGYCDLKRALCCMCTGEFEWQGEVHHYEPDPYGRWIVAANHLRSVPGFGGMDALADGLRELAVEAGRRGFLPYDESFDYFKANVRRGLTLAEREVWDVLAHPLGVRPDRDAARALAERIADAALADEPRLDPAPALARMRTRVVLAHGRQDRLIPFPETMHLSRALRHTPGPPPTITNLFAHSTGAGGMGPLRRAAEALRFMRLLGRAMVP
jgi:pimeloyl-ACP methyl ester carboxylesterase